MAGAELSRRVETVVGYPPLVEMDARLEADSFEDLPGKWQAAVLQAGANRGRGRVSARTRPFL